nr:fatty-acid amide hydrolase 2 isoform X1 [Parasteatoda tepidariorum]
MASIGTKIVQFWSDFVRVILTLTWPISDYVLDFIYQIFMGKTKVLPPIDNRILLMPATKLAEKIRRKQLSCEEVMKVYIERSKQIHPFINAVVDERYDEALKEAQAVDEFLSTSKKSVDDIAKDTPLLGVPFSCKEAIGVKDLLITLGMVCFKTRRAEKDSDAAALYRKAGAIPLTITNIPESCMWWESANHVYGMTKNPYDNARTVGGSSGGEGSLITSAGAVIGIGNDLAGSIRIPASFCGIYGHKPTRGIVSNKLAFQEPPETECFGQFISTGPMCRYAEDLPLLTRVLANNHENVRWNDKIDFCRVKFYYMEEIPGLLTGAIPEVKESIKKAVKHFEEQYGVRAVKVNLSEMKYAMQMWECKLLEAGSPSFKSLIAGIYGHINLYWEAIKNVFHCSPHTLPAIYFAMVDRRDKDDFYFKCLKKYDDLKSKFEDILQGDSIFLMPTHRETPPHYLMTIPKYKNIGYTSIFSILGFPSTQIPAGLCNGLPIGIQAISRPYGDHLTIATALELDQVFNGWISPCPVSV